ncbi:hypothetical protein GALMADRAFT_113445 [Galerina marginata CBS 339.88]|uniref:N-acetyltransferase domain-containing protein n=1 Tax=Galerina marginata (strain CBS 339.88) TaxID=685588 RepID=A0A067TW48_GALM3|nr:hypothetical protein GALMADRAFT_113445 [Galerina marginata CBS 339.88]
MDPLLRDATKDDLPQIVDIMNYYIKNTTISLRTEVIQVPTYVGTFDAVREQRLPFFVAEKGGKVVGFTYAMGFRMPAYQGYCHTAEITIYLHPKYQNRGVGSKLMNALMDALKHPRKPDAPTIKQVLSIMTLNEDGPGKGYGLRDWYGRWGFIQVGHLKKVGFKQEKWLDVLITQASLEE